jgi:hypothetical protein
MVAPITQIPTSLHRFTDGYVERCLAAKLRRWPERLGRDALRLEKGDFYAWPEGLPVAPGAIRVALLSEPRPVWTTDRIWWIPRLDQLLERLEQGALRRDADLTTHEARHQIALQLAALVRGRDGSWEEIALDLMLERESRA